jgi:Leucine-rich repeat (LRR) protein
MRKTSKQSGGNMAEAQRRVDDWVKKNDTKTLLDLTDLGLIELPTLPNNLKHLYCYKNKLVSLPTLPESLETLECWENKLDILPILPTKLKYLNFSFNNISKIPELPDSLESLACNNNNISEISKLPSLLQVLVCNNNTLETLPELPSVLNILICNNNNLKELPTLPPKLKELECNTNKLKALPELPKKLKLLDCTHNLITSLPTFPATLIRLKYDKIINTNKVYKKPSIQLGDFMDEQKEFLKSLTNKQRNILYFYTQYGDRVINEVLRGNISNIKKHNPVFITNLLMFIKNNDIYKRKENNKNNSTRKITNTGIVKEFISDFLNVFKKVPLLKDEVNVYRGVKRKEDINNHGNEFLSTSYFKIIANKFAGDGCCALVITLKPGVRALWIEPISRFPNEKEILICPPFKFEETSHNNGVYNITISPVEKYRK